jgi:AAA+ ATPase superfamily predicted ATPase
MSSTPTQPNPFIYGRPVRPGEFLDREAALRTVFNRLRNAESTAIVGEPHIGKTSLLLQIADGATQRVYLGDDTSKFVVSLRDLHPTANDYTPATFWEEALESLRKHPGHRTTSERLEQASAGGYSRRLLERLFNHLA